MYSWMNAGLTRLSNLVSTRGVRRRVPADRLANGCKKILGLLGDGGKVFEDDVAVVGTDPKGS